jgi:pimeloyl-ACP methyl ester carboxylesterase
LSDAVLLLHGQPGRARDWDGVLAALGAGLEVVAIDRPGWGDSGPATGLEGNARAALAALDARGLERATIVGHSLGGGVAAWLGAFFADRVSALVLAAPAANADSLDWFDRLLAGPVVGPAVSGALMTGAGLALSLGARLAAEGEQLRLASRGLRSASARRAFVAEQRTLLRDLPALQGHLSQISAPTVVVHGTLDLVVAASSSRQLVEQIPGARLVELAGAGHLLPQRHAERLAEVIRAVVTQS